MKVNKTPSNNELTKEFYKTFLDELQTTHMESKNETFHTKNF